VEKPPTSCGKTVKPGVYNTLYHEFIGKKICISSVLL